MKYSEINLRPLRNHKFMVLKDIYYKDLIIEKGFRSDGGSVPRIFWSLFPPNETTMLPLYIVHDYLCDLEQYDKADKYLLQLGKELSIKKIKLYTVYFSVRLYHLVRYKIFKKNKKIKKK